MGRISNRFLALAAASLAVTAFPATANAGNDDSGRAAMMPGSSGSVQGSAPLTAIKLVPDQRSEASLTRSLGEAGIALPAGGIEEACAGFQSLLRCVGALHIAKNVRVSGGFAPVRDMLLYDDQASLADAARAFAPEVDPLAAEKIAQAQASADLRKAGLLR